MKTDGDDLAWKREFDRVEVKQEQRKSKREGWDGKREPIELTTFEYLTLITNEINNESSN